ncbi:MAG: restriction endonuclease subunit S [Candidatus Methanofastidiosa archaeon]|nr:restriction endonuclease subunit S [Candidatus Methanofastidiosa archaeon]
MEVKTGYKNSVVGIIPEDWDVFELCQILKVKHGKDQKNVNCKDGRYPILGSGGLIGYANQFLYDAESVLIGRKGTIDKPQYMDSPFWTVDTLFYTEIDKSFVPKYIFYNFNLIDWYSFNEASGVPSLNAKTIGRIKIPLPSYIEQQAITEVLSDTDNLIQALEKQIAKKRLVKQGVMQKLLTPKEGWEVKPLNKIVQFLNGKAHEQFIDEFGEYVVINSKFVSTDGRVWKNSSKNLCPLKKGDITMVMSDIPNGKALAKCFVVPENDKYALNQRICALRAESINMSFLKSILNRNEYFLAFDSGTGQTNLKKADVLNCPVPLPSTLEEQNHIATILSDLDIEIETIEEKLSKYKSLKQGLMQNLLTGKIRLITNETV